MPTIFAFDLGTASLGECVNRDNEILHAGSWQIPDEWGSLAEERSRRRMYRTRIAHQKREDWLAKVCADAGLPVLLGRQGGQPGDPRLEREFPPVGDETCYTSCLLRLKLLRGEPLAPWQIYKALHSAIQRRGYDPEVAWKVRRGRPPTPGQPSAESDTARAKEEAEEKESRDKVAKYEAELAHETGGEPRFAYPCYLEAALMGLCDPATDTIRLRQDHQARRARCRTAPRKLVVQELTAMINAAARQFPKLAGQAEFILYGPSRTPYGSFFPDVAREFGLRRGADSDWDGVLGQKIPRFDNRLVDTCSLMPRFHVCGKDDGLFWQVNYLLGLMRLRYWRGPEQVQLTPDEVRECFKKAGDHATNAVQKAKTEGRSPDALRLVGANQWKLTQAEWKKYCKGLGGTPVPTKSDKGKDHAIEAPALSGRCRFSRHGLRLLKDLILSGESPHAIHARLVAALPADGDPAKGLVASDYDCLLRMPDDWRKIHIPAIPLATQAGTHDPKLAVADLLARQRNPLVRLRLQALQERLLDLTARFGQPDQVVLEFIREDFIPARRKLDMQAENRKRQKAFVAERDDLASKGISGGKAILKMQLLKQQGGECLYTGQALPVSDLDLYEIEHIIPRGSKYHGSDFFYNKVLTTRAINAEKGERTPHEWLQGTPGWESYLERVKKRSLVLGRQKVTLLTAPPAEASEALDRYANLAETAWIARTGRDLICLSFGWQPGAADQQRRITVISGQVTAAFRKKYQLNSLINAESEEKLRSDPRHHALDAMVLSYLHEWQRNPTLREYFPLPQGVHKEYLGQVLATVVPRQFTRMKPALEATIYGRRPGADGSDLMVVRKALADLIPIADERKYNPSAAAKVVKLVTDPELRRRLEAFFSKQPAPSMAEWARFLAEFRQGGNHGARVICVTLRRAELAAGDNGEYRDLNAGRDPLGPQWRKGAENLGYFLYRDAGGKVRVRPVLVHESRWRIQRELAADKSKTVIDYFWSGCQILLEREVVINRFTLQPGEFRLSSIRADGRADIRRNGQLFEKISAEVLLASGMKRVDKPVPVVLPTLKRRAAPNDSEKL